MTDKPLQLIRRPNLVLTKAQVDLYALICVKLKSNEPILYEEAKDIYFAKACQNLRDGWPHWWNYWGHKDEKGEWVGEWRRYSDDMVKYTVFNWLTSNIGKLVMKGALKIIPQIELS